METISIQEFVTSNNFTSINECIRVNINGYPFVTFINADNVAENVYFSKSESEKVIEGTVITMEMLKSWSIATTTNAAGELRMKIVGAGKRLSLASLFV